MNTPPDNSELAPANLRRIARGLFTRGPTLLRLLQHHRPTICPFGPLLECIPAGSSVLDIGCGGGLLVGLIGATRRPKSLTGFDSSAPAIALAQANFEGFPSPRPNFLRLDVNAPWPAGPFDCVTMCDVLHHVPRKAHVELLCKLSRYVKPGGRFVYKDVYPEGFFRPNMSRLHDLVIARERIYIPEMAVVHVALAAMGLRRTLHRRINTLWYGHELAVFEKP